MEAKDKGNRRYVVAIRFIREGALPAAKVFLKLKILFGLKLALETDQVKFFRTCHHKIFAVCSF